MCVLARVCVRACIWCVHMMCTCVAPLHLLFAAVSFCPGEMVTVLSGLSAPDPHLTDSHRTVPKFMKRSKAPDYRDKMVFGVPPIINVQRTGQPLPQSIQQAMRYVRSQCLDQVRSSPLQYSPEHLFICPHLNNPSFNRVSASWVSALPELSKSCCRGDQGVHSPGISLSLSGRTSDGGNLLFWPHWLSSIGCCSLTPMRSDCLEGEMQSCLP